MMSNQSTKHNQGVATPLDALMASDSDRKFVRGKDTIAVYRPEWNQTGHMLTRWEAEGAYGKRIIEEALEYSTAVLRETPNAIQDAFVKRRDDLGLGVHAVATAANLSIDIVTLAEAEPSKVAIQDLERIAFVLGLDERFVAFKKDCGGDAGLGVRLKVLQQEPSHATPLSERNAVLLSEAASVIRVQHRLQNHLQLSSELDEFAESADYGSPQNPAWRIGYALAQDARERLSLGDGSIPSMRELVEQRLGIPVVQVEMNPRIAGATVTNTDEDGKEVRGIVLNIAGENENVWVRRATLAHELGHLLYDPDDKLDKVRVDLYSDNRQNAETYAAGDFVEQRANAFAIAFLAPVESVRRMVTTPITFEDVRNVMETFGISHTAAKYHIGNCRYRQYTIPETFPNATISDEWIAAENFTTDYFPLEKTPNQRRGKFAGLVASAHERGFISEQTAALYLASDTNAFATASTTLRALFDL